MEVFSTAAIWVVTVILAAIPIWGWHMLNKWWLRPKRLERLLIAQGLRGDPYKLSLDNSKQIYMLKSQQEAKSKSSGLSEDAAPWKNSFLWEGTTPKVIIMNPEQIKEVFNNIQDFPKPELSSIAKYLSNGLINNEGEKWAKHRKIINPAFHIEKLKGMLPAFSQSCHEMMSKWRWDM